MAEKSLRVLPAEKTFFGKITNTLTKLLIPTKIGINGVLITIKRNNLLKAYETYVEEDEIEEGEKKEAISKKYEDMYGLYLESIDKYIMDSIYKKVKNNTASEFEKNALSKYYTVIHLKETQYIEYKHRKQKYLLELDYESLCVQNKEKILSRYKKFYADKMESLYKGILKNYSIQLADSVNSKVTKDETYEKIFNTLEEYITEVLPIKIENDKTNSYREILDEYDKFNTFLAGKLDGKDKIEKRLLLLGISRKLFTHSLPLVVAEQGYIKLLKDTRNLIISSQLEKKQQDAFNMLIALIEDYNIKLLSTKIYWDKPASREEYKKFWNEYNQIIRIKDEQEKLKKKQILFIKNDLKALYVNPQKYSNIIKFYKNILVQLGVMKNKKNSCKTLEGKYTKNKVYAR